MPLFLNLFHMFILGHCVKPGGYLWIFAPCSFEKDEICEFKVELKISDRHFVCDGVVALELAEEPLKGLKGLLQLLLLQVKHILRNLNLMEFLRKKSPDRCYKSRSEMELVVF